MQMTIYNEPKSFYEIAHERVTFYGEQHTSLSDLFALIIGKSVDSDLCNLLSTMSVKELLNLSIDELRSMGYKKLMAERIYAVILLSKKINSLSMPDDTHCIRSPEDAYNAVKYLQNEEQEKFVVLALDTKNNIIARKEVFCGTLNASIVHPREVFRFAIQKAAASIVVAHQHPSGDPMQSREDCEVTKRLVSCGKTIGVEVLDHIIVGKERFISLKEKGYL